MKKMIGFVGQGYIGKNYADDFERRGFTVVRYALEEPYAQNKERIATCDIVFIAVPTPTTPEGFNDSIVREAVKLVGKGKITVIKSTVVPGTTESIQKEHLNVIVMHSPEFLMETTAAQDAAQPIRNIIGIPQDSKHHHMAADEVMNILPPAPYKLVCSSQESELVKYGGNCLLYLKVLFANMLYDLATARGSNWEVIREAMSADPRIGGTHLQPIHKSGRGAGGNCFIKDFATFTDIYAAEVGNVEGDAFLRHARDKNIQLLVQSGKDLDLLESVYGKELIDKKRNSLS